MDMNSDNITADQLKSLEEFLPTKEEEMVLKVGIGMMIMMFIVVLVMMMNIFVVVVMDNDDV